MIVAEWNLIVYYSISCKSIFAIFPIWVVDQPVVHKAIRACKITKRIKAKYSISAGSTMMQAVLVGFELMTLHMREYTLFVAHTITCGHAATYTHTMGWAGLLHCHVLLLPTTFIITHHQTLVNLNYSFTSNTCPCLPDSSPFLVFLN